MNGAIKTPPGRTITIAEDFAPRSLKLTEQ
jgi:hypothetical protein